MRRSKMLHNGLEHGFKPLEQIELEKIFSFSDLAKQMANTSFGGRTVGRAAEVMTSMFNDPDCTVIATLSGAMTIAKQGGIIADLIENGCISAVVSTGAIICHGISEELGNVHFEYNHYWNDEALYKAGYDRVFDTLELESSMDQVENLVFDILSKRMHRTVLSSSELCFLLGEELHKKGGKRGFIKEAYQQKVPIFIPAFSDSELGLDVAIYNARVSQKSKIICDPLKDLDIYTKLISKSKCLGILTIGGGVPRNWAQQVGPYSDSLQRRGIWKAENLIRFQYGVRICPEPVHWGGLSGCTYSEGISWGKFAPKKEGGQFVEVLCDATIVLPFLTLVVFERLGFRRNINNKQENCSSEKRVSKLCDGKK